jgi:hypothetical protein
MPILSNGALPTSFAARTRLAGGVNGGYETIADIYSVGSVFAREIQREILDENWDWILGAVPAIWAA